MQTSDTLPVGTKLNSGIREYEILSVLGQGGFGITYLAKSEVLVDNIPVEVFFAIKEHYISKMNERVGMSVVISNENNRDEINESIDSFITEAKRLNKLSLHHPGIVRVNENFKANDTAYYVMEYIKGSSVRKLIRQTKTKKLYENDALQLFRPIVETIGYLHKNKVTHLDIKPDNILIRENGKPVIIDFGLSKHYNSKGTPTSTIKTLGCSDGYSPMEQYAGITTFTPEADIYALAATLLYMLTGRDPQKSTEITPDIIRKSLPNNVSERTTLGILKAMEKLKENRTSNINKLIESLYTVNDDNRTGNIFRKDGVTPSRHEDEFFEKEIGNSTKLLEGKTLRCSLSCQRKWIVVSASMLIILFFVILLISIRKGDMPRPKSAVIEMVIDEEIEGKTTGQICSIAYDYEHGTKGKVVDYAKALYYYKMAAGQGDSNAMAHIGYFYDLGIGVKQNYDEAVDWYRKAAQNNSSMGQNQLGSMYKDGRGVEQNYEEAFKWFKKAAENGNSTAQLNLGIFYQYGKGIEEDLFKAQEWYKKAAISGNGDAKRRMLHIDSVFNGYDLKKIHAVLFFPKGRSVINEDLYERLGRISNYYLDSPSKNIAIMGFTDSGGNEESNKKLAEARAISVKERLVSVSHIEESRITIKGVGGTDLFENNSRVLIFDMTP